MHIFKKLKGFTLDVKFETCGQCIGILGASGSGKSMTLKCIAGIERPDKGRIVLNHRVLFDSEMKINLKPQRRRVGYLFQNYALFPNMTVSKNIGAGLTLPKALRKTKIADMLGTFHLEGLANRYPSQLSGGEQQRVALARILANRPDVLMLDEPFSALDSYLREQLQTQVQRALRTYTDDTLLVSHNRDEICRFCKNAVVLDAGRVVNRGDLTEMLRNPGNLAVAKLSGCKNISRATKITDNLVFAKDWGARLRTAKYVSQDVRYVAVWPQDLEPTVEPHPVNPLRLQPVEVYQGPLEVTIVLSNSCSEKIAANDVWQSIRWKVTQKDWTNEYCREIPRHFAISPENVILLTE